ncbi:MAG: 1-acyl-sn-glycerol-3-phosphate acyltransferase [Candidatus Brocadiae bacterium]|nr:1-acyl-sn-glycerol-3-phosphate acyltransferase [Candidatus Brocadiia bacterium]
MKVLDKIFRYFSACLVFMVLCSVMFLGNLFLLPYRVLRIRFSTYVIHILGAVLIKIFRIYVLGNPTERIQKFFPAIYVLNHASALDVVLSMFLAPIEVVSIAKKEVAWIPFLGWAYFLSGHLLIDRKNKEKAISSLNKNAEYVKKNSLGVWIWAEGTRSQDGRLQPFKKGFAHIALATRLPIVPVVMHNTHKKWPKHGLIHLAPFEVRIQVLDPIDTTSWTEENLDNSIQEVRMKFIENLGPEQKPL